MIDPNGFYPSDLIDLFKYGQMLLHGEYFPRYPLPAVGLFALLSLIPIQIAYLLIVGLSIVILVSLFQRRSILWACFAPISQCLVQGQIDVLCLWLLMRASPVSLALLTLKPQLFVFALPTLLKRRELWKPFALWCLLLWGVPTLVYPQWIGLWLGGANDGRLQGTSSSLWPVPLLAFALIVYMVLSRRPALSFRGFDWRVIASSLNPLLRSYDYTMLAGSSVWLVPLSWACVWIMWQIGAAWPMALVSLPLLIVSRRRRSVADSPRPVPVPQQTPQSL
jgi:hypothetical protein